MSTRSIVIGSGPGQIELQIGVINDGDALVRSGDTIEGVARENLASAPKFVSGDYSWDSADSEIVAAVAGAAINVTLPAATSIDNWAPGTMRTLWRISPTTNGINLLAPADVSINYGTVGNDLSPIPTSTTAVSASALGQRYDVYRGPSPNEAYFFVIGPQ